MTLRPVPARWFEALIARDDLVKTVQTLAATGDVELEVHSEDTQRAMMPDLRDRFDEYNRMLRRYQAVWPTTALTPSDTPGRPSARLDRALHFLHAWQSQAEPVVYQLEQLNNEQTELTLMLEWLSCVRGDTLDFGLLTGAGPTLAVQLFVLPVATRIQHFPPSVISLRAVSTLHLFVLAVGLHDNIEALQRDLSLQKGRALNLPAWLSGNVNTAVKSLKQRISDNKQHIQTLFDELKQLENRHNLHQALGDIQQLEWFITHVSDLPVTENFAWVTGWTGDRYGNRLNNVLERNEVRAIIHYPPAPLGMNPPMMLQNPWWSKPFELFARMLGTPSANEFDPSTLLVFIAPLLFGYMFGDIGQGLVLFMAGFVLRKRYPVLKLLAACGLSSIVFGFVFGSVFGNEHIITPLWVSPIQQPLTVLFTPLAGGVLILLLGLSINGLQAYWRGEWRKWIRVDAAVIALYAGIIASLFYTNAIIVSAIGVAWYLLGHVSLSQAHYLRTLGHALGELTESVFQLIINTISFIRVGAFALAHAGLSLAVIIMADAAANTIVSGIILILGNVVILFLEGLVVSIQTTRLVLFEFFIRFLQGTGRMFNPLQDSTHHALDSTRRTS